MVKVFQTHFKATNTKGQISYRSIILDVTRKLLAGSDSDNLQALSRRGLICLFEALQISGRTTGKPSVLARDPDGETRTLHRTLPHWNAPLEAAWPPPTLCPSSVSFSSHFSRFLHLFILLALRSETSRCLNGFQQRSWRPLHTCSQPVSRPSCGGVGGRGLQGRTSLCCSN